MNSIEQYLDLQIEILESKLKVMERYKKSLTVSSKRTSKIQIVEEVLATADRPLHVTEIIKIAEKDFQVKLHRDSIVSNILKKINSGQTFKKTGPNTFTLKSRT